MHRDHAGPVTLTPRAGWAQLPGSSAPFGAQKVQLRSGAAGAAKILFRGRGANLDMPDVASLTGPIDVRLIKSGGGVCWGATYSAPFLKNDGGTLKDKADRAERPPRAQLQQTVVSPKTLLDVCQLVLVQP